jgi:DNA-directed RNA polymerase I, II, and III subunit RPABC1
MMQHETDKTIVYTAFFKNIVKTLSKSETEFVIDDAEKKSFILIVADAKMLTTASLQTFQQKDKELHTQGGMLQIFTLKELQYNPNEHVLVPKHEKVPEEEIKDILSRYQVKTKSQLPVIVKTDMMARWLGLKHGDIVRITRHNENSGTYYFYRCCV